MGRITVPLWIRHPELLWMLATDALRSCSASQGHKGVPIIPKLTAILAGLILSLGCGGGSKTTSPGNPPTPSVPVIQSFSAAPSSVAQGQSSILSWSVTGATSLSISGVGPVSGSSLSVTPASTTTYTLTASNATGNATRSTTVTVGSAGATATVLPSRTTGVAPLYVNFTTDYVGSLGDRAFHDYAFSWSFGDPGSGSWGTNGKPKNAAQGPVAAHVFETPGTYTVALSVRDASGAVASGQTQIVVSDPEVVYAGTKTTCVSDTADFTGAPTGARQVTTNDLSTITQYATAGSRILFRRGGQWSTSGGLAWPENAGPVTIGAFGAGTNPDALGICANAPRITVTSGDFMVMTSKQDWRIMDLSLVDPTRVLGTFGGAMELQRQLYLRLKIDGFDTALGWSHWNTRRLMPIDEMAIVSCDLSNGGDHALYVGSERLAILGCRARDARSSHVVRVWQAYRGVIAHNEISGSSLDTTSGRHALKFHGPKETELSPADGNGNLRVRSSYSVVSDNVFGSSGPWPITIAPQDSASDERLSHILFERNRYFADFGNQSATPLQVVLRICGRHITVRNNVLDGSNAGRYFTGIAILRDGVEPAPEQIAVYHNTIYKAGTDTSGWVGISVDASVRASAVRNNLIVLSGGPSRLLDNASPDLQTSHNLLTASPGFTAPGAANPLARDFRLQAGSPALGAGTPVPVFEDFDGNARPQVPDLGAFEQ